jgi:ribonucleoside-diphosphate reductase alpha chain
MIIKCNFTNEQKGPYYDIVWEKRNSVLHGANGKILFSQDNVIVPSSWSQIATDIIAQKYFRKTGVPVDKEFEWFNYLTSTVRKVSVDTCCDPLSQSENIKYIVGTPLNMTNKFNGGEYDARQVFHRLAYTWTVWGKRENIFNKDSDADIFYEEVLYMLSHQMAAPNSPQWFNTGLYEVYGISGIQQNHYYYDKSVNKVVKSNNAYERPQTSACFILPVEDDLLNKNGIYDTILNEARIFKYGSGAGVNFSKIRGKYEKLSGGGKSSGLLSFLKINDRSAASIKSGGTCLAPFQRVFTENGPIPVKDLAESGKRFITLSYHPPLKKFVAKWATAWKSGQKIVMEITTNKGEYYPTFDHPVWCGDNQVKETEHLKPGEDSLFNCGISADNFLRLTEFINNEKYSPDFGKKALPFETSTENIIVEGIRAYGFMDVYNVSVECDTPDDKTINSGHNFVIWPHSSNSGCGIVVFNTRRAALMCILDIDHPDIEEFIEWKVKEEHKIASLVAGSEVIIKNFKNVYKALDDYRNSNYLNSDEFDIHSNPPLGLAIAKALDDGVPSTYLYQYLLSMKNSDTLILPEQFSVTWGDESYDTVSGQSTNNSIRITDAFMNAVENDEEWNLTSRISGEIIKTVKAKDLWDKIIKSAWNCADPGIQFHDAINSWHTTPQAGEIRASNPCSEFMAIDGTSCNLASINLSKFYNNNFDVDSYMYAIYIWTIILEISTAMAQFPSELIAENSYKYRFSGLGYANLGSLIMKMGVPYDSEDGRNIARSISSILTGQAYYTSALLSKKLGPFIKYNKNKKDMLKIIDRHKSVNSAEVNSARIGFPLKGVSSLSSISLNMVLGRISDTLWKDVESLGREYGFRNAQVTCIAPTGTIGLLMDCDTTGIEPDFALVKFKKLSGGGQFKIVNHSLIDALINLEYTKDEIDDIIKYTLGCQKLVPDEDEKGISVKKIKERARATLLNQSYEYTIDNFIEYFENKAKTAMSIHDVFGNISKYEYAKIIYKGAEEYKPPLLIEKTSYIDIIKELNFTQEELEYTKRYICGSMTVEGSPHLKPEHYSVFDTASLCGKYGTRIIDYMAHVKMMAAVQPFISGGISKTINMPGYSTFDDVAKVYMTSWKMGLKSITIYRDNSKLSQPLSSFSGSTTDVIAKSIEDSQSLTNVSMDNNKVHKNDSVQTSVIENPNIKKVLRKKLPAKRKGYIQKIKIAGHSLFLHTGEYEDGSLGEIFIDMHREGAAFRSLLNSFAIAISLGIQYGVPLEEYVDAFVFSKFEPNGMIQDHKYIKMATSVIDYIFRDIAINYLGRYELGQVKPDAEPVIDYSKDIPYEKLPGIEKEDIDALRGMIEEQNKEAVKSIDNIVFNSTSDSKENSDTLDIIREARNRGYEGDPCPTCGAFTLIRNGTCMKCDTCGNTTGCS